MRRRMVLAALAAASVLSACSGDTVAPAKGPIYFEPTSQLNLLANLRIAYEARDLDGYLALLAPEFRFHFRPSDVQDLGLASTYWTREEDAAGTARLFAARQVSAIRLQMTCCGEPTDTELAGSWLRVGPDLEVDQTDGVTWIVTGSQSFSCRRGIAAQGEDPDRWFLYVWGEADPAALATS